MNSPIRIISDLHLGHRGSLLHSVEQIGPLLKDTPTLIFNGDTLETQSKEDKHSALSTLTEIKKLCNSNQVTPHFISGNHDPDISDLHHITLRNEEILITHGDVLFPDIVPWSPYAPKLSHLYHSYLQELTAEEQDDFIHLLQINKKASLILVNWGGFFVGFARKNWAH